MEVLILHRDTRSDPYWELFPFNGFGVSLSVCYRLFTLADSDSDSDWDSDSKPYHYIVLCRSFHIGLDLDLDLDSYSDGFPSGYCTHFRDGSPSQ